MQKELINDIASKCPHCKTPNLHKMQTGIMCCAFCGNPSSYSNLLTMNTKENPEPLSNLIRILELDYLPPKPSYKDVRKGKITGIQFHKINNERNEMKKERKHFLKQFQVGSYRDYEGDGYFNKPLYLYEGKYYA